MKTVHPSNTTRRAFLTTGTAAALAALAGCVGRGFTPFEDEVSATLDRSFSADAVRDVRVRSTVGAVTVRAIPTDGVDVRVVKRSTAGPAGLDDILVAVDLTDGVLSVETDVAEDANWFTRESPSTDVTVTVPRGAAGPLVSHVEADLGSVAVHDTRGDLRAESTLGSVTVTGVRGFVDLRSDLGEVVARDVAGLDGAASELGTVDVDVASLRRDVTVATEMGSVRVAVADHLDLDVVAEGRPEVATDLPLTGVRSGVGRVAGRLNRGGRTLHATSELGSVSVERLLRG
jgi:hypothetical protein